YRRSQGASWEGVAQEAESENEPACTTASRPEDGSGASSTSRPGRGRALGRAATCWSTAAAEPRPAGLSQAAAAVLQHVAISEPETAVPLTIDKQDAGAAQHRPGCRTSS